MKVRRPRIFWPFFAGATAAVACFFVIKPNLLWLTVHDLCGGDMALRGSPFPCLDFNRQDGVAVLNVIGSRTHFLVVPTARISGIESPQLRQATAGRYWQAAWMDRRLIETRIGRSLPRDDFGLAVNSRFGRTQNQLHIHVDCVQPSVVKVIKQYEPNIGTSWEKLPFHLMHHSYSAMRIYGNDLSGVNPVAYLYDDADPATVADSTLAILGETFADGSAGFVLIKSQAHTPGAYRGFSEELLDHRCRVAAS